MNPAPTSPPGRLVSEGRALRSFADAFRFTTLYPEWCSERGVTLADFVGWMQVRV